MVTKIHSSHRKGGTGHFDDSLQVGPSTKSLSNADLEKDNNDDNEHSQGVAAEDARLDDDSGDDGSGMDEDSNAAGGLNTAGSAGPPEKTVKPLTPEALATFNAAQERTGVIYISRIPPGMRPVKVRHLMSAYGEIGRVYLQQEDPKRAYLRKKFTSSKKPHYTEGWVEFKDKRVARSVAEMLNAQSIGGKKGTRWRDDVWTMKYLPKFKWSMLTEQIAHESAVHTARLRVELAQSRTEQQHYLRQVELARVLDKRAGRKRKAAQEKGEQLEEKDTQLSESKKRRMENWKPPQQHISSRQEDRAIQDAHVQQLEGVLGKIF